MSLSRYLRSAALVCWCGLAIFCQQTNIVFGQEPTIAAANEAMNSAVRFFREKAGYEGGYVFRWSSDLALREGEEPVGKEVAWIEPPATPAVGKAFLDAYRLTGEPTLLEAARETAQALVRGQLQSGGWDDRIEFAPTARARYAYRADGGTVGKRMNSTTFDDDKTQSVIRFLLLLDHELQGRDHAIHEAVAYALDAVLQAQYPNGAWPQRYSEFPDPQKFPVMAASYPESWPRKHPGEKYSFHYTLNDGAITDLIQTLLLAWDLYGDQRFLEAAKRGGDFFILSQMPSPQPGWAQQYDVQLHPIWARKFEPPAISGGEGQGVMKSLLLLYRRTGEQKYLEPLPRAIRYYRQSELPHQQLARFYELKTNRPLYFTRRYELTYDDTDLPTHYGFVVSSSVAQLEKEMQEITQRKLLLEPMPTQVKKPKPTPQLLKSVDKILRTMDSRGAWVEAGKLKQAGLSTDQPVIESKTFIRNLLTLAEFIAASR